MFFCQYKEMLSFNGSLVGVLRDLIHADRVGDATAGLRGPGGLEKYSVVLNPKTLNPKP